MENEYEEYMDAREERWSPFKNLSPKVIIIFFIVICVFVYLLISGNAKNKDYIIYGGLVLGALILLLKSNTSTGIKYISLTTAMALLLEYHKWYNVLRKPGGLVRGIALPKGQIEPGHHSKVPHWNIKHQQEWIYWEIGFTIYDEEDNNTPKYFLAKIDPLVGGAGLVDVEPLKRAFDGWRPEKQYFVNPMAVPVEKYFEMKSKGQTTS